MASEYPTLYLDIDGILNNIGQVNEEMLKRYNPATTIESIPLTTRLLPFDRKSLYAVNYLLGDIKPHLRITSSWRYYSTPYSLEGLLASKGLSVNSIKSFNCIPVTNSSRAHNIDDDIKENLNVFSPYVIVEDSEKDVLSTFPEESVVYVHNGWLKDGFNMRYAQEVMYKLSQQYRRYYGEPTPWD